MNNDNKIMLDKKLSPFKIFAWNNFPFIEDTFDSLTNYQLYSKIVDYLNDNIDKINQLGGTVQEYTNAFLQLKDYIDNYFNNLDVQDEINTKLDDMAEKGELADIINQEIFEELNQDINTISQNLETLSNNIKVYPFFDMLKNNGFTDGQTPNDNVFNTAKTNGYRKFYFPQNSTNNANYYFTNTPNFNDCEIKTDDGVVLNFPAMTGINNTHEAKFKNNVLIYSRQQERIFNVPKNESDFFNQFSLPNYKIKNQLVRRLIHDDIKVFSFDYDNTGLFIDNTSNKNNYYQSVGYDIRYKAQSKFSLFCVQLDRTKNKCIEIVSTPNTRISFGWVNSNTGKGVYAYYYGSSKGRYYFVNGTANQQEQTNLSTIANLYSHNGQNSHNNNWSLPIKYKLRCDPDNEEVQLYINDNFVEALPFGADIDYFGFGINETSTSNLNSDKGFSEPLTYEQKEIPLNSSLNILIAGDSRMYGYNSQYHIEDVIKNGLKNNGVNVVNITNISVSGWSMQQIYEAIQSQDLSNFDVVIVPTGINNYTSDYQTLLQIAYNIMTYVRNNGCFCIFPATIPVGYNGTDTMANQRADVYYKIQQALLSASGYVPNSNRLVHIVPNVMGTTILENNIEVCSDGVHPTTEGTILFAKSLVNTILHLLD